MSGKKSNSKKAYKKKESDKKNKENSNDNQFGGPPGLPPAPGSQASTQGSEIWDNYIRMTLSRIPIKL